MRFHVVYRNAVNGKVEPISMEPIANVPHVKLPTQAKIVVVDKKTGKIVEKVAVTEVDGNVVVTAEQDGVRESVVIDDGQARGVALLGGSAANEMVAGLSLDALASEGGSSAALYIAGGVAAVGGGAAFAASSDKQAPTFSYGPHDVTIAENSPAGSQVYVAQAVDNKGKVTYSLKSGGDAGLVIDPASGRVTLSGSPDYETKNSYNFTVVATDPSGNSSEQAVTVAVSNVDERAPTITSAATGATIRENTGAGQVVYTATATDNDFAAPATANSVTYSLKPGSDAAFTINSQTGAVTLIGNPNYEAKSDYNFTVIGTDAAGNPTEKAVTLHIGNLDEVRLTITSDNTATTIAENSGAGQAVYTATGTDTDFNAPATAHSITWSLKPVDDAAAFSINAETGVVTLLGNPDYETKSSYNFTVIGTDAAGNPTEKGVTLNISDVSETSVSQTVFVLAEGFGHFVDGGNGTFDGLDQNNGPQGDDIGYSTIPGDAGYVDFANNAVTVKVLGLPDLRPLDITGFGADDHVEIFLSTMQDAFGSYDVGSVNFGTLHWSAFVNTNGVPLSPNDPQYHMVGMNSLNGLLAMNSFSRRSVALGLLDGPAAHGLVLGYYSAPANLTPQYNMVGPILVWNSSVPTNITPQDILVHWPTITIPG